MENKSDADSGNDMTETALTQDFHLEQNIEIGETVKSERAKLLSFIRSKIPAGEEAEDILQDVFYELI